jgi:hypothetical protein
MSVYLPPRRQGAKKIKSIRHRGHREHRGSVPHFLCGLCDLCGKKELLGALAAKRFF